MLFKNRFHVMFSFSMLLHVRHCEKPEIKDLKNDGNYCWNTFKPKKHFENMAVIDDKYKEIRKIFKSSVENKRFDNEMFKSIIEKRGIAKRTIHAAGGKPERIPAGLNLGGNSMIRIDDSLLFIHRMKLRNNTNFRINFLHNDLDNMLLKAQLSLNDLHLQGTHERALFDEDNLELLYIPIHSEIDILLKDVTYAMEGRYRLLTEKLNIELVVSEIKVKDILLEFRNNDDPANTKRLQPEAIGDFLDRLKVSLDNWLKDYFNDYLLYFNIGNYETNVQFTYYDISKTLELNEYVDTVIQTMKSRMKKFHIENVVPTNWTIFKIRYDAIFLRNGSISGLDTMFRRSVATGMRDGNVRHVDTVIGFSDLKLIYQFDAILDRKLTPISGMFVFSAADLSVHMGLTLQNDLEAIDITFDSFHYTKPETLIIKGPVGQVSTNFQHNILQTHVTSLMSNALLHNVKMLSRLTQCEPKLRTHIEKSIFLKSYDESTNGTDKPHKLSSFYTNINVNGIEIKGESMKNVVINNDGKGNVVINSDGKGDFVINGADEGKVVINGDDKSNVFINSDGKGDFVINGADEGNVVINNDGKSNVVINTAGKGNVKIETCHVQKIPSNGKTRFKRICKRTVNNGTHVKEYKYSKSKGRNKIMTVETCHIRKVSRPGKTRFKKVCKRIVDNGTHVKEYKYSKGPNNKKKKLPKNVTQKKKRREKKSSKNVTPKTKSRKKKLPKKKRPNKTPKTKSREKKIPKNVTPKKKRQGKKKFKRVTPKTVIQVNYFNASGDGTFYALPKEVIENFNNFRDETFFKYALPKDILQIFNNNDREEKFSNNETPKENNRDETFFKYAIPKEILQIASMTENKKLSKKVTP